MSSKNHGARGKPLPLSRRPFLEGRFAPPGPPSAVFKVGRESGSLALFQSFQSAAVVLYFERCSPVLRALFWSSRPSFGLSLSSLVEHGREPFAPAERCGRQSAPCAERTVNRLGRTAVTWGLISNIGLQSVSEGRFFAAILAPKSPKI